MGFVSVKTNSQYICEPAGRVRCRRVCVYLCLLLFSLPVLLAAVRTRFSEIPISRRREAGKRNSVEKKERKKNYTYIIFYTNHVGHGCFVTDGYNIMFCLR